MHMVRTYTLIRITDESHIQSLSGQEVRIPSLIVNIDISFRQDFKLRAIIVTEHRNIDLQASELGPYTRDILFVQVINGFSFFTVEVAERPRRAVTQAETSKSSLTYYRIIED